MHRGAGVVVDPVRGHGRGGRIVVPGPAARQGQQAGGDGGHEAQPTTPGRGRAAEAASWLRPAVTSLRLPLLEMGERAVDLLLGGGRAKDALRLPLVVQQGGSVA